MSGRFSQGCCVGARVIAPDNNCDQAVEWNKLNGTNGQALISALGMAHWSVVRDY